MLSLVAPFSAMFFSLYFLWVFVLCLSLYLGAGYVATLSLWYSHISLLEIASAYCSFYLPAFSLSVLSHLCFESLLLIDNAILNLLFYSLLCFALSLVLVYGSRFFFGVVASPQVLSPYECGFEPLSTSHSPFCIKFFLLAILFIVFDVEVAFLVPTIFSSVLIWSFVLLLLFGLYFEFCFGSLSWVV